MSDGRAGADGSLMVRDLGTGPGARTEEPSLHFYSPEGDPVRSIPCPSAAGAWGTLDYDGKRFVTLSRSEAGTAVVLYRADGRPIGQAMLERPREADVCRFAPGGPELWVSDRDGNIERYKLPAG